MRLSGRNEKLQIVEGAGDLEQLGQDHGAQMATANDANLERGHLVEQLLRVLHNVRTVVPLVLLRLTRLADPLRERVALLALLISSATHRILIVLVRLLAPLQKEGLFVENEIVVDAGEEDAFKHDQVAHYFTGEERVL